MSDEFQHDSVLLHEAVDALVSSPNGVYIDATFGRGGHTQKLLDRLAADARVIVFDKDPEAIAVAQEMSQKDERIIVCHSSFSGLAEHVNALGLIGKVSGVLADLGVSSPQLDDAERGFSFMRDGALDMRMDTSSGVSAAEWLAVTELEDMVTVLKRYGEERFARRIATAIVERRSQQDIRTTRELAALVEAAIPVKEKGKHPATRTFQAIRIAINNELGDLEQLLQQSLEVLVSGGRLVAISFHSLEDRIVKRFMREQARGKQLPARLPVMEAQTGKTMRLIGKAIKPGEEEVQSNRRARSAVMRVAERL